MLNKMDSRWSLGTRLSVLSGLFLIPIAMMAYLIVDAAMTNIEFAAKERRGVEYANQVWPVLIDATKGRTTDLSRLGELRKKYDEAFSSTQAADSLAGSKTPADRIDNAVGLLSAIADGSNLTLDPDLDSFYAMDLIVNNIPSLVNAASDIRAELASKTRSRDALVISANQMTSDVAAIERKVGLSAKNNASGDTRRALTDKQKALNEAAVRATAEINAAIAGKKVDPTASIEALVGAADQLWSATSNELDRLLAARNANAYRILLLEAIAVVVVLICATLLSLRISGGLSQRFKSMVSAMEKLSAGDLKVEIPCQQDTNETGHMAKALLVFKQRLLERARLEAETAEIHKANEDKLREVEAAFVAAGKDQSAIVDELGRVLSRVAQGDLTARIEIAVTHQYEKLKSDFNAALLALDQTLRLVADNAESIRVGGSEIAAASDDLSKRTEQQAANLEETAAALEQITITVENTASGTRRASEAASSARDEAQTSGAVMRDAVSAMSDIKESSGKIAQIITVIDEIAFQTNLLALNAGVEAARAGEAGKGFAVVASEVRALAQRAAGAAKEIKPLITESTNQVDSGAELVARTGEALERIVAKVTQIDALVSEFSSSAEQQATGLKELNTAVGELDKVTQQNAAMVEEATAASASLKTKTNELSNRIAAFRVTGAGTAAAPQAQSFAAAPKSEPAPRLHRPAAAPQRIAVGVGSTKVDDEGWQQF